MNPERPASAFHRRCIRKGVERMAWVAEYQVHGRVIIREVSDGDAWDFDLYNGLPILVRIKGKHGCVILRRLKDNKRFVKAGN